MDNSPLYILLTIILLIIGIINIPRSKKKKFIKGCYSAIKFLITLIINILYNDKIFYRGFSNNSHVLKLKLVTIFCEPGDMPYQSIDTDLKVFCPGYIFGDITVISDRVTMRQALVHGLPIRKFYNSDEIDKFKKANEIYESGMKFRPKVKTFLIKLVRIIVILILLLLLLFLKG